MACADVNSANVVGYQGLEVLTAGRKAMCFTFSDVGATAKKMMLSEIKLQGYQDSTYWQKKYQCPQITLKKLGTSGAAEAEYSWKDEFDNENEGEWDGGHWEDAKHTVIAGDKDVEIKAGDGFFVDAAAVPPEATTGCKAYSFLVNGEVIQGSYAAEILTAGRQVMGNMMPAATKLSKVEIQGYQDSTYWQKKYQCPQITLKKLATSGAAEAEYSWKDEFDNENEGEWDGGHWEDAKHTVITGDKDVTVNPGESYFVDAAAVPTEATTGCKIYTFVFPACLEITK